MRCEVCGSETDSVFEVHMEDSVVQACGSCRELGTDVSEDGGSGSGKASQSTPSPKPSGRKKGSSKDRGRSIYDDMEEVVDDYDSRIRGGRESHGLTQGELASRIGEKLSLVKKLESGDKIPEDSVAEKLERTLDIELHGESGDFEFEPESSGDGSVTLGDVAKIKRKD